MGAPRSRRVIAVALGSFGDVHPILGVARALALRGHDVRFIANPLYEELVRSSGLTLAPVGEADDFLGIIEDPRMWQPRHSMRVLGGQMMNPYMRPTYERIAEHYGGPRTIVLAPFTAFGARVARDKLELRLATLLLQPIMFRSAEDLPGVPGLARGRRLEPLARLARRGFYRLADRLLVDPVLEGPTNAFRAELGLPPVRRVFADWLFSPDLVVGLFPRWFGSPQGDWPPQARLAGFPLYDEADVRPLSPELEEFLAAGDPPVVITPGTANRQARRFFEVSVAACRELGRRGLLLTHFPEQTPDPLPSGFARFDYAPFSQVLSRAACLIYHGGVGTAAQALAAGTPQLVVPSSFDQPDNAARLRRLGVSRTIYSAFYTRSLAVRALRSLLQSAAVKQACRRRAEEIRRMNPLEEACEAIESLAPAPACALAEALAR